MARRWQAGDYLPHDQGESSKYRVTTTPRWVKLQGLGDAKPRGCRHPEEPIYFEMQHRRDWGMPKWRGHVCRHCRMILDVAPVDVAAPAGTCDRA